MSDFEAHRTRLIDMLAQIETKDTPDGWEKVVERAVGGLLDIGFSRQSDHLLVVSSSGRGVIDCRTGEKVARDYEDFGDWRNVTNLTCEGVGPLAGETILTTGLHGGGMPHGNTLGDHIEVMAPNWPLHDLFFCQNYGSPLSRRPEHRAKCVRLVSDYLRAYGFSWCGKYLVSATSSDLILWKKL